MTLRIEQIEEPTDEDRASILSVLRAYNASHAGDPRSRSVALMLNDDHGQRVGGLWATLGYDWMFVAQLAVPENRRGEGYGSALMHEAERIARRHCCVGIWLDTFEFQARAFYERLGFEMFGELEDHPKGFRSFFLKKSLGSKGSDATS